MSGTGYEINVRGRISDELLDELEGVALRVGPPQTVLHGHIPDQAALFGILERLHANGVEVVEVRLAPDDTPSSTT